MTAIDRTHESHHTPDASLDWLSLHLRCDGNTDEFLRGPIQMVLEELDARGTASSWFYLRYWEGGPHIRLRLLLPTHDRALAAELVREQTRPWLNAHDPEYPGATEAYAQIARSLATREAEHRELLPWQPHGRIWEQTYVPETAKYGAGASLQAFEQHFRDSSELALRVLRQQPSTTQVLSLATLLVLTGWARDDIGPTMQSRADLLDRWSSATALDRRPPAIVRPDLMDRLFQRARTGQDPWSRQWSASLDELHRASSAAGVPAARWRNGADICQHLLCNRLGLTLEQELTVRRSAWAVMDAAATAGAGISS